MSQHRITVCQPPARVRPGQPWLGGFAPQLALVALLLAGPVASVQAQTTAAAPAATPAAATAPVFKDEELDQMLAPVALYPDSLLAQVLMASTYPVDVKSAAAWSKAHPDSKGDAALKLVDGEAWDPSVKSLAAFPQVLAMMGEKPDNVQRLGDAFLADPKRVMDRVQFLRKKAQEAGNLKTNEQQKVSTTTEASKQVIIIEPAQPNTVYVPAYQPTVYGSWWYPSYPPYYWAPPPYYYPPGGAFVAGVFWGAAVVGIANGLWGGCNWGGGNVNINVNKYNNVNVNNKINNGDFNHNADRRGDVPYRDSKNQAQNGQKAREGASSRESYRGKEGQPSAGTRDAQRANAESTLASRGADPAAGRDALQGADRGRAEAATRDAGRGSAGSMDRGSAGSMDRGGAGASSRDFGGGSSGASSRDFGGGGAGASNNALSGAGNAGASRADASRGQSSRSSMGSSSAGASRSGGASSFGGGGGGARGGGGGGGGRGGGGRR